MSDRRDELAAALARVGDRVEAACRDAGRDVTDVTVVVVTKFFPASDVSILSGLGVSDFGENRDQEAGAKWAELREAGGPVPRLHFIGQLQTNKAGSVARYADAVHSVDRVRLVTALDKGAAGAGRRLSVLMQVDLDESGGAETAPRGRGGARPADLPALADAVAASSSLDLRGLMAVAPLGADPGPAFARLRRLHDDLRRDHPGATWLSAGMSGDLEAAVAHGATHLRVGTAILGPRPPLR